MKTKMRFTIDGVDPEDKSWTAVRFGRDWNGWATPVVDRITLESIVALTEDPLHYIENVAVISGEKVKPDRDGNYDMGLLGWCFIEVDESVDGDYSATDGGRS